MRVIFDGASNVYSVFSCIPIVSCSARVLCRAEVEFTRKSKEILVPREMINDVNGFIRHNQYQDKFVDCKKNYEEGK